MRAFLVFLLVTLGFGQHAFAEYQFELDKPSINITTGFNGDSFSIYGTKKPSEDVVVVVRGPNRQMKVRQKQKVMGGWINNSTMLFDHVPSFYRVAASKDLLEIADEEALAGLKIGVERLDFKMHQPDMNGNHYAMFRQALMRNKEKEGLMKAGLKPLEVLNDRFVRATFSVPHNVTLGVYDVGLFYFDKGILSGQAHQTLEVKQVGMNAKILVFARDRSLLYGLFCVFLAIFAGWLSNRLKRVL